MKSIVQKIWPAVLGVLAFIVISSYARNHLGALRDILNHTPGGWGMALFVLIGIVTVVIPFASLLPFIPIAVVLWDWPATAALVCLSWVLGSQILFEAARYFGKPVIGKFVSVSQLKTMSGLVEGKSMFHGIFMRMVLHGDIVSYAFGLFTDTSRLEFCIITAIGVAPGAVMYAYFGSLPLTYQVGMALAGLCAVTLYWALERKLSHGQISLATFKWPVAFKTTGK
ncbi:MAG: hypothetical protein JWM56_584 [Candidatus Peribacteria bacterium]|nr:hypothetical protein [Candidatus Peribacteria bacterium]